MGKNHYKSYKFQMMKFKIGSLSVKIEWGGLSLGVDGNLAKIPVNAVPCLAP